MLNKLDGIDALVSSFEQLHSIQDEAVMERSSTLTAMLKDGAATDEEFIHFWLDARKYAADYARSSKDKQRRLPPSRSSSTKSTSPAAAVSS